jgi:hypothetical protein
MRAEIWQWIARIRESQRKFTTLPTPGHRNLIRSVETCHVDLTPQADREFLSLPDDLRHSARRQRLAIVENDVIDGPARTSDWK